MKNLLTIQRATLNLAIQKIKQSWRPVGAGDGSTQVVGSSAEAVGVLESMLAELETESSELELLPTDYKTHHSSWLDACLIAENEADTEEDKSYWKHELEVLDRINQQVRKLG